MELSINTIIVIVLGLLVLVILIFILQKYIHEGTQKYFNLSEEAEKQIRADDVCEKMFSGRVCLPSCNNTVDLGAEWKDCKLKAGTRCCQT